MQGTVWAQLCVRYKNEMPAWRADSAEASAELCEDANQD